MVFDFELRCAITAELGLIRDLVRLHGRHSGLPGHRLEELVLAVNEAVTNVLDHGGGAGTVTARNTGGRIVVEVLDVADRLTHDHLAAAVVDPAGARGYGLWLIQHLCDGVELERTDSGSLLRLHVQMAPTASGHASHPDQRTNRRMQRA
ncbi:hypothetical protein GCM10022224_074270 [Nonomuraea antimicrobica]|uniref:Histidine kinase/HSP90-like ATPase domain-containing protein n=1 Tax=Nonomuraea antimicrobica TaxID=561173 RepID=A0ABP7D0P4_9ACTN